MSKDKVRKAVCPGSFDPVTFGHLDVFARAAEQFDHVTVAVLQNSTKAGLFTMDQRIEMITECVKPYPNIVVDTFKGLLVDYCRDHGISAIFKGLRAVSDFDYELQMAQVHIQASGVETMFMATSPTHSFLSSSIVKELAHFGGDVSSMVPTNVNAALMARVGVSE